MKLRRPKISKKKIAIFSVFVFVATIFWFLDALNRVYTTKVEYPVEFYNFPKDVLVSSDYPDILLVTIKANGFDIIRKMNISDTLEIDIEKFSIKDKTDKSKLILSLNKISEYLFYEAHNIDIISIKPETVEFKTVKVSSKEVPVKLKLNYSTSNLYMQSGEIELSPKSIIISGEDKTLSKISFIETVEANYENLEDTLRTNIKLSKILNVNFSQESILFVLPIEKYTENEIKVPVSIINCPENMNMKTFPNEVKLTYKVSLSRYNTLSVNNFKVVADYTEIKAKNTEKIQAKLIEHPKHIESIKIFPEFLEYLIENSK